MSSEQNKNSIGIPQLLLGYALGFFSWLAGFHCMELDPNGNAHLSPKKFVNHFWKVALWAFVIGLLAQVSGAYIEKVGRAPALGWAAVLLVWAALFLVLRFVKNGVYLWILPGFQKFSCPQCYQTQTFRFQPVSFQLGFWVTYLCPNCACLVDGGGEQIIYPIKVSLNKLVPGLLKSVPAVLVAIVVGMLPGWFLGHYLRNF